MDVSTDGPLSLSVHVGPKMSVVDTVEKKVIKQVPVGKSPHGVWTLQHAPR